MALYYRDDWRVLQEFAGSIFEYAQFPFLEKFDVQPPIKQGSTGLALSDILRIKHPHRETGRVVASGTGPADVYVFRASPDDLVPLARVFRRDELPYATGQGSQNDYQRPIDSSKLRDIRSIIASEPDFMFPNSIICILSSGGQYDGTNDWLILPKQYGTLTVVDGQHRLFSYAGPLNAPPTGSEKSDVVVPAGSRESASILVMGIRFQDATETDVTKFAAKTFAEINRNHTRVQQIHLYLIEYDVLGTETGTALAGKVILNCNRGAGAAQGLFKISTRTTGTLPVTTIIEELAKIVDLDNRIRDCQDPLQVQGFENLFNRPLAELTDPDTLVGACTGAMKRYFNLLRKTFGYDWPSNASCKSIFRRAKFFAALIRLFDTMLENGKKWNELESDLLMIRQNVLNMTQREAYEDVLFVEDVPEVIPNWKSPIGDLHAFLNNKRYGIA